MERMPDARAGWQIPNKERPWIRTIHTLDPLTGVPTEWRQDLGLFRNRRIDTLPNSGFRRIITESKPNLEFPVRLAFKPLIDEITYRIEEMVGDIRYDASLEDPVDLASELRLGIDDSQENCLYNAYYRPNTLAEVEFFLPQTRPGLEEEINKLSFAQNLNNLLDLVKIHGEIAFVPHARFSNNPQQTIENAEKISLNDINNKAVNWTLDERKTVAVKVAVWLRQLLQKFLPNEKSDGPEMSTMDKWLYLETMRGLPRDFEMQTEKVQMASFEDASIFAVLNSLLEYERSLAEVTEYTATFTFGSPAVPVDVKFSNMIGEFYHATKLQDGERQHFDIYDFSIERGENITVAFQRLVRPWHRFEFRVPQAVNVDEFRRIVSVGQSTGWEKAKEIAWARYIKGGLTPKL